VAQIATSARPAAILELLLACARKPVALSQMPFRGITGPISNARMSMLQNSDLIRYLFSRDEAVDESNDWNVQTTFLSMPSLTWKSDVNDPVVLSLLRSKIDEFSHTWTTLSEEKSFHITSDHVQIMASICVVTAIFTECLPSPNNSRTEELIKTWSSMWHETCAYISNKEDQYVYAFLDVLAPIIWSVSCKKNLDDPVSRALDKLAPSLLNILRDRRQCVQMKHNSFELEQWTWMIRYQLRVIE